MAKNRAKILILSEILSFPTISGKNWRSDLSCRTDLQIGDLVSLSSAPPTKWFLSWLREVDPNNGWPKYLLESIEDGELCWWENVGLNIYSRERVTDRPSWKWDDKQFEFNDRWHKVCRNNDAYIVLPCQPVFHDDGSVLLDVRIRFQISDYRNPKTFPNWKKVTMKLMDSYYNESVKEYEATSSTSK